MCFTVRQTQTTGRNPRRRRNRGIFVQVSCQQTSFTILIVNKQEDSSERAADSEDPQTSLEDHKRKKHKTEKHKKHKKHKKKHKKGEHKKREKSKHSDKQET
jgi:hypothetical protein